MIYVICSRDLLWSLTPSRDRAASLPHCPGLTGDCLAGRAGVPATRSLSYASGQPLVPLEAPLKICRDEVAELRPGVESDCGRFASVLGGFDVFILLLLLVVCFVFCLLIFTPHMFLSISFGIMFCCVCWSCSNW